MSETVSHSVSESVSVSVSESVSESVKVLLSESACQRVRQRLYVSFIVSEQVPCQECRLQCFTDLSRY